jgi:hypothetical protein
MANNNIDLGWVWNNKITLVQSEPDYDKAMIFTRVWDIGPIL